MGKGGKIGAAIGATVNGPSVYTVVSPAAIANGTGLSVALGGTSFRDNQGFECSNCAREASGSLYQVLKAICR